MRRFFEPLRRLKERRKPHEREGIAPGSSLRSFAAGNSLRGVAAVTTFTLFTAGILIGCGSAPEPTERSSEILNRSREFARTGVEYAARGDLQQAELFFARALSGFRSIDNRHGTASTELELARAHVQSGSLSEALDYLDSAAETASQLEDPSLLVEARTLRAEISLHRNDPRRALELLQEAEELLPSVEDESERGKLQAVILHNRGVSLAREERYDAAHSALSEALALNQERSALSEIASNHYMLASVESRSGNYEEALRHAEAALENDKATENSSRIALDLEALAQISIKAGELAAADDYFARATGVYEALSAQDSVRRLVEERLKLAEERERPEQAERMRDRLEGIDQEGSGDTVAP